MPNCLLPVCNQPLLAYQLALLESAGFREVLIAVEVKHASAVESFMARKENENIKATIVRVEKSLGSADVLRAMSDYITRDFFVIAGDLVCESLFQQLANTHRLNNASMTMTLQLTSNAPLSATKRKAKRGAAPSPIQKKPVREIVGLEAQQAGRSGTSGGDPRGSRRVLCVIEDPGKEQKFKLPKSLLRRVPAMTIHSDVEDMHLYLFSNWIIRLLTKGTEIHSIKKDLVPFLVHRQFRGELSGEIKLPSPYSKECARLNTSVGGKDMVGDCLRCFCVVVPTCDAFTARADNLENYATMNRSLMVQTVTNEWKSLLPKNGLENSKAVRASIVGENAVLNQNSTLKDSVVGDNVTIGTGCKIQNCILMDNVTISDGCTLQNSIICHKAQIQEKCTLDKCQVGVETIVPTGSKLKDQQLASRAKGVI
eukprot:g5954.t1